MYLGNVTGHGSSVDMETLVPTNPNEGLGVVEQKPSKERNSLMTRAKEFIKESLATTKVEYVEVPVETVVEKIVEVEKVVEAPASGVATETSDSVFFDDYVPAEWSEQTTEDPEYSLK